MKKLLPYIIGILLHVFAFAFVSNAAEKASIYDIPHCGIFKVNDFRGYKPFAPEPNQLRFLDLRGTPCYPQPDRLIVCGPADTVPILLFTKNIAPIYDVVLNIQFEEGLEYTDFAYVASGNANLDTINVDNPESVSFYLDEISQAGGGVVVYFGINALCNTDYDVYQPSITYSLTYEVDGQVCTEEITPDMPYAENVLEPEITFDGPPSADPLRLRQSEVPECVTLNVTNITPNAPTGEAFFTIDDYGFDDGITITSVSVNGETLPYTPDPVSGRTEVFIDGSDNPNYWGGDGLLSSTESIPIEVCYQLVGCIMFDANPTYTIVSACDGAICGGSQDQVMHAMEQDYSGGPTNPTFTYSKIQDAQLCDPVTGDPVPYVAEITFTSGNATPITGDIWSMNFYFDTCFADYLTLDSAYMLDGPGGSFLANIPDSNGVQAQSRNTGRFVIDFRDLADGLDIDGPGGLDDLDGDGIFDDLPAGESIVFRIELTPSCDDQSGCGGEDGVCNIQLARANYQYNCKENGRTRTVNINDPTPAISNNSEGGFDNPDVFSNGTIEGYDFDIYGYNSGAYVSSSKTIKFGYTLDGGDLFQCGAGNVSSYYFVFEFTDRGFNTADFDFTSPMFAGTTPTIVSQDTTNTFRRVIYDVGNSIPMSDTFSFIATLDTPVCARAELAFVSAYLVENCTSCNCEVIRACAVTRTRNNPENDMEDCTTGVTYTSIGRTSFGYSDKCLTTKLDANSIPEENRDYYVPGDTIELSTQIIINTEMLWNEIDDYLVMYFRHFGPAANTPAYPFHIMRPEFSLGRVQSFLYKKQDGTVIDVGANSYSINTSSPVVGPRVTAFPSYATTDPNSTSYIDPTVVHPGLSTSYQSTALAANTGSDYGDGNTFYIYIRNNFDPSFDQTFTEFKNSIGGAFEDNDTICITIKAPLMCIPAETSLGTPSVPNSLKDTLGIYDSFFTGYKYVEGGTGQRTVVVSPSQRFTDTAYYVKPTFEFESRIDVIDNCSAEMVIKMSVEDTSTVPAFPMEFRPFAGVEDIELEIPMPYYIDAITYEHCPGEVVSLELDSVIDLERIECGSDTYFVPLAASGKVFLIDSEKADGLRSDGYLGFDAGDNDITEVGGTFPLIGIGAGNTQDSIVFRVQLKRICGSPIMGLPIQNKINASINHLPDYDVNTFYENNTFQWTNGVDGPGSRYWPYDRQDENNPHQIVVDSILPADFVGPAPTLLTGTLTSSASTLLDGTGTEMTTITLESNQDIQGAFLSICVDNAVSLESVGGMAPVEVAVTDSNKIYLFDVGAMTTGTPVDIAIETDLLYCNEAEICIKPSLGCSDDPEKLAKLLALSGKECDGIDPLCMMYLAGLPDTRLSFVTNNNQPLCDVAEQSIIIRNTGSSPLADFFPTVYLPQGYDFVPGSWMSTLSGTTATLPDPTQNTSKSGLYGLAFEWPLGTFSDLLPGQTLIITFEAMTTCDMVLGTPIWLELNAAAACEAYNVPPVPSDQINVLGAGDNAPLFKYQSEGVEINCAGENEVVITATNVGKAPTSDTRVCIIAPPGINLTESNISFLAPQGASVNGFTSQTLGDGSTLFMFSAPDVGTGGFFCVALNFAADLECGELDFGFQVKRTETISCNGAVCDVQINMAETSTLTLEVVPGVNGELQSIDAQCTGDPSELSISYNLLINNPSDQDYQDDVVVNVYYDIDISGTLSAADPLLGSDVKSVNLPAGLDLNVSGFIPVPADSACPLLVRVDIPGCSCNELIFPVPEVSPDFVADLGTDVFLCPNEEYPIVAECGTFSFELDPTAAGSIRESNDSFYVSLFDGYGEDTPVKLMVTSEIGACSGETTEINLSRTSDFSFPPYSFEVCNEGCQQLDFGIDINLLEDIEVNITPSIFLLDPTSPEPIICDPTRDQSYTVEFSVNGQCMTTTTMDIVVVEQPEVTLLATSGCSNGFSLRDVVEINPADLEASFFTSGDGSFTPTNDVAPSTRYVPGPEDIEAGSVQITVRTDNPDGPCGPDTDRNTFSIRLVNCGGFPWGGN